MRHGSTKNHIIGCAALALLAAWAPGAFAATAEERAECKRMLDHMGTGPTHEHSQDKGQGPGQMTLTHEQCKKILAETGQGEKKQEGSTHDH